MVRRSQDGWRWTNVPVPEPHIAGLLAGLILHRVAPRPITRRGRLVRALGWPLLFVGAALAAWAVRVTGQVDTADPTVLVTEGPYAFSKNPMYVAWTFAYAGISLIANAAWPLALLPAVAMWTYDVVRGEERSLEDRFGEEYREYAAAVRRYV